jgi:DNA-binding response OmpR family regulator
MADAAAANSVNFKVLIGDDDSAGSRRLVDFLKERGFAAEHAPSGKALRERIKTWRPTFVICDLTLTEFNAPQLLSWVKSDPDFKTWKPKVLVTSAHNVVRNIKECITLGASDYIVKPYKLEDILTRLIFHIQNKRELLPENKAETPKLEGADIYLHLMDIVLREAMSGRQPQEIHFNLIKMIAITLKAVRCSMVKISEDLQAGEVQASSDDKSIKGLKLDMNKYPEMVHVMNTGKAVVIEDLEYDPMLAQIKNLVKGISFNSMIVSPVRRNGDMYGVISARMAKEHSKFNERDIRFVTLVSQVLSLYLSANLTLPHEWAKDESA